MIDEQDDFDGPSKSQRKRDAAHLRALGQHLGNLPQASLKRLPLPEDVAGAIADLQRFSTHAAKRRQVSRVGKLLRNLPSDDIEAIELQVRQMDVGNASAVRRQHAAEAWRDRLLADAAELNGFIAQCPQADRNRLRALTRRAGSDRAAFRELYRELLAALRAASSA